MSLRIGVIGVGYLGQHHVRIFSELEDVTLTGIFDLDAAGAGEIARKFGCRAYDDPEELIAVSDAVSIVTPTTTHHKIALACLKAGKDVFIEKPITESLEEAREIIKEADERGRILQEANDFKGAEQAFKRGIALAPSYATGFQWYPQVPPEQVSAPLHRSASSHGVPLATGV